jgi:prepilin-type processing-associated H-X9-DG protein
MPIQPCVFTDEVSHPSGCCTYEPSKRHFGGSDVVFVDGHAGWMRFEVLNNCNNFWDGRGVAGECRKGAR